MRVFIRIHNLVSVKQQLNDKQNYYRDGSLSIHWKIGPRIINHGGIDAVVHTAFQSGPYLTQSPFFFSLIFGMQISIPYQVQQQTKRTCD